MEKNEGKAEIAISMKFPKDMHQEIKELAKKDRRSIQSYILHTFDKVIRDAKQQS